MCPWNAHSSERGFSLLEMLMTLAVLAILGGLAIPGFGAMILDSRRAMQVNSFVHSIFLARSTAIQSGEVVSLCRSVDGQTCSPREEDWQEGWIAFINLDRDEPPVRDPNERVLATFAAWTQGTMTSNRRGYSFRPHNHAVVNGTMIFCDRRGSEHARAVIINSVGRPRVANRDSSNRPLRCPTGSP